MLLLNMIKSSYIIKKILRHMEPKKIIKIIKYNKEIHRKLNIDFTIYIQQCLQTHIIIYPKQNTIGNFINIPAQHHSNYEVTFDNKKVEPKRNYIDKDDDIKSIEISLSFKIESFINLFKDCTCIKKVVFIKFNRTDIESFKGMFFNCSELESIDFIQFNTKSCIDISSMFYNCANLKYLKVDKFDIKNVRYMNSLFEGCTKLQSIDLSYLNAANVIDINRMFYKCNNLNYIKLPYNLNNKLKYMSYVFYECNTLQKIDFYN